MGPYSVGGTVGAATMRHSAGAPMSLRIAASAAAVGTSILAAGLSQEVVTGISELRKAAIDREKFRLEHELKMSQFKKDNSNNSDFGGGSDFTANSPLETGEISNPLLAIFDNLVLYNIMELVMILVIIYVVLNIILKNKLGLILVKYIPTKFNRVHNIVNYMTKTSEKMDFIFIFVLLIVLLLMKLLGIYLVNEVRVTIIDLIHLFH